MSGQVFEVNEELTSKPSLINKSAEGKGYTPICMFPYPFLGWICKIAVSEKENELGTLLSEEQYNEFVASHHDEETSEAEEEIERHKKDQ